MDIREVLVILKRRKWIFLAIVAIVLLGYVWTVQAEKQFYTASGQLFVVESTVRSIMGVGRSSLQLAYNPAIILPSWTTLLTGPVVYEKAVHILNQKGGDALTVLQLKALVVMRTEEGGQKIIIEATGTDPRLILAAIKAVAQAIQEYAKELAQVEYIDADRMLVAETKNNHAAIQTAHENLERLRREFYEKTGFEVGFGGFEQESERLLKQIDAYEQKIKEIESARAILESKIELFGKAPDGTLDLSQVALAIDLSPYLDALRQKIVDTRTQRARLLQTYTERHPEVASIDAELTSLMEQMRQVLKERHNDFAAQEKVSRRLLGDAKQSIEKLAAFRAEFMRQQRFLEILLETQSWLARTLAELHLGQSFQAVNVHSDAIPDVALPHASRVKQAWPFMILLAVVVGGIVAYASEYLDDTLRSEYQVSRYLNLDIVGHFPFIDEKEKRFIGGLTPSHPLVEVFNRMAARILAIAKQTGNAQVILVSSPCADDGKTTVAANIAVSFAFLGQKVVLVDADLRKPRMHNLFELKNDLGLSTYLTGRLEARQALQELVREEGVFPELSGASGVEPSVHLRDAIFRETSIPNLKLVTAGPVSTNPMQGLESAKFAQFLQDLRRDYDRVLIDSPPLQVAADAARLASRADVSLLVLVAGVTRRHEALWAKHFLAETGTPILGAALNKVQAGAEGYTYYYYYGYDRRDLRERV